MQNLDKTLLEQHENLTLYPLHRPDIGRCGRIHATANHGAGQTGGTARSNTSGRESAGIGELHRALHPERQ